MGFQISRIRELRRMKQQELAIAMNVSQQTISNIENSETIKEKKLEEIAKVLGVTKEVIKNFSDEIMLNVILKTFTSNDIVMLNSNNDLPNFSVLHKITELYERLLKAEKDLLDAEKEKVFYLEKLLNK